MTNWHSNRHGKQSISALAGLIMALIGGCTFYSEFNTSGLVMSVSILTVWAGLALLLLVWHSKIQENDESFQNDSMSAADRQNAPEDAILNCLGQFGRSVYSRSVMLLESADGSWRYVTGWNCSTQAGDIVAALLFGRVKSDSQDLVGINVIGEDLMAFCTPIHWDSKKSQLLVVLSDLNSAMPHNIGYLSSLCSFSLIKIIESSQPPHCLTKMRVGGSRDKNPTGSIPALAVRGMPVV